MGLAGNGCCARALVASARAMSNATEGEWCFMLSALSDAPRDVEVIGGGGNSPLGAEGYESAGHQLGLAWHEDQGSVTAR